MSEKPKCPSCGAKLQIKALTDSDQRIWQKWRYCERIECGWDERGTVAKPLIDADRGGGS